MWSQKKTASCILIFQGYKLDKLASDLLMPISVTLVILLEHMLV